MYFEEKLSVFFIEHKTFSLRFSLTEREKQIFYAEQNLPLWEELESSMKDAAAALGDKDLAEVSWKAVLWIRIRPGSELVP